MSTQYLARAQQSKFIAFDWNMMNARFMVLGIDQVVSSYGRFASSCMLPLLECCLHPLSLHFRNCKSSRSALQLLKQAHGWFPFPMSREMGLDPGVFGRFDLAALVQPHLEFLFVCLYTTLTRHGYAW